MKFKILFDRISNGWIMKLSIDNSDDGVLKSLYTNEVRVYAKTFAEAQEELAKLVETYVSN